MKKGEYESYLAACPFYCREDSMAAVCCGWEEGIVNVSLKFRTAADARRHKDTCCRSLKGCTDCPVHQMLMFESEAKK